MLIAFLIIEVIETNASFTAAVCSLDEIQLMTDELFEYYKDEIDPGFHLKSIKQEE